MPRGRGMATGRNLQPGPAVWPNAARTKHLRVVPGPTAQAHVNPWAGMAQRVKRAVFSHV